MTTTTRPRIRVRPPAPIRSDAAGAGTPPDLIPHAATRAAGGTVAPAVASPEPAQPVAAANDPSAGAAAPAAQSPEHHRARAARTDPTSPAGHYEVGYGKPPPEHRFKPGQSGNPSGRKKGARNFRTAFDKSLSERITYIEKGKRKSGPAVEVIATGVRNKALRGDDKAIAILAKYSSMLDREPGAAIGEAADQPLSEADQAILDRFLAREIEAARMQDTAEADTQQDDGHPTDNEEIVS